MNVNHYQTKRDRSYFDWRNKMQIVRKGKGEIAMTESELVDFFNVTWKKLNYQLQLLLKTFSLHPEESNVGEVEVLLRFIHSQSSSLCLINWTAWKPTCSENTSVESCNALHL